MRTLETMLTAALAIVFTAASPQVQGAQIDVKTIPPLTDANSIPFAIPYNDPLNGGASDVSFLNAKPAGRNGRIVAKDGHFTEAKTGKRVNFLGTNVTARAAFPSREEADAVAARLAKMGVNLVRLHHLQNGWEGDGGMIWKADRVYLEVDPKTLDRLDYFIAALIKQGVYVNMNLTTSRIYQPEMGFPAVVTTLGFSKRIDKFNRKMIALQKEFARTILDRKNPYTGRMYRDEPGLMIVEINNENSLVGAPWEGLGSGLATLPEPFLGDLKGLWTTWLRSKYRDDAGLKAAWAKAGELGSKNAIGSGAKWSTENQSSADVIFSDTVGAASTLVAEIKSNPGPDWHVQAHVTGITLENGKFYTVTFRGKASGKTSMSVGASVDGPDWHNVGLNSGVELGPEAKEYALSFRATDAVPAHSRIAFILGASRGRIEISDLMVREGQIGGGLPAGESLAAGTVSFPPNDGTSRAFDWLDFLTDTETAFTKEMQGFLRNDLGFKEVNLLDSQTSWGGLTSLQREQNSDYDDTHEYWNHPNFVGGEWNPKNYIVNRAAISGILPDFGTLGNIAVWRRYDRPHSVSEYDHPAPSDYVAEMMPLLSTFAAHQGWDALYTFNWENTGIGRKNDAFDGYFDQARNPAKLAFYPASALIFRNGLIPTPAYRQTLAVAGPKPWHDAATPWAQWGLAKAKPDMLGGQVGYAWRPAAKETIVVSNRAAPSKTITITGEGKEKVYTAASDRALAITGFTNGRTIAFPGGSIKFGEVGAGLTGTMLVPLDGALIAASKRMLLTAMGRAENVGMAWNAARNSVSDGWGTGPVRAEFVPMVVTLNVDGPRKAYALDPMGKRLRQVSTSYRAGVLRLAIGSTNKAVWIEITK